MLFVTWPCSFDSISIYLFASYLRYFFRLALKPYQGMPTQKERLSALHLLLNELTQTSILLQRKVEDFQSKNRMFSLPYPRVLKWSHQLNRLSEELKRVDRDMGRIYAAIEA